MKIEIDEPSAGSYIRDILHFCEYRWVQVLPPPCSDTDKFMLSVKSRMPNQLSSWDTFPKKFSGLLSCGYEAVDKPVSFLGVIFEHVVRFNFGHFLQLFQSSDWYKNFNASAAAETWAWVVMGNLTFGSCDTLCTTTPNWSGDRVCVTGTGNPKSTPPTSHQSDKLSRRAIGRSMLCRIGWPIPEYCPCFIVIGSVSSEGGLT